MSREMLLMRHIAKNLNGRIAAFGFEHGQDVLCGAIAEELAKLLFVVADAVLFDERDEIGGRVIEPAPISRSADSRREILRLRVKIREIAAPAARKSESSCRIARHAPAPPRGGRVSRPRWRTLIQRRRRRS